MPTVARRRWDATVAEICDDFGLRPQDVRARCRKSTVNFDALFQCKKCRNVWSTHRAWITIDFKLRKVVRVWKQRCLSCELDCGPFAAMEKNLRITIRRAVLRCLEKSDGIFAYVGHASSDVEDLQHKRLLCEKCLYGCVDCLTGDRIGDAGDMQGAPQDPARRTDTAEIPRLFLNDGWRSWQSVRRLYPTWSQREVRAEVFHRLKIALCGHPHMHIDVNYLEGVYEAGSMKKGTQLPWSDFDVVLFVTDFRPCVDFFRQRFNIVTLCLQAEFGAQFQNTATHRFSRGVQIEGRDGSSIKFDILLGSRIATPNIFIRWGPRQRQARSASSAPFQIDFVRAKLQPSPDTPDANTLRDAILSVKCWKSLVCRHSGQEHYLPSYLIELIGIECQIAGAEASIRQLFWLMLDRLAKPEEIMIDFVMDPKCKYTARDLERGLVPRREPSVADPGNPTNDVAKRVRASSGLASSRIDWQFWKLQVAEARATARTGTLESDQRARQS